MTLLVAHAGHWLLSVGFAAPPLLIIGGVLALAMRERHRDGDGAPG